jgi:FdhD protein
MRPPARSLEFTQITQWEDGHVRTLQDSLAVEEPLEIRIRDLGSATTMRTPGHDLELTIGQLLSEGVIASIDDIAGIQHTEPTNGAPSNVVEVKLNRNPTESSFSLRRTFAASGCGLCGKATIESVHARNLKRPNASFRIDPEALCTLPEALMLQQELFSRTGGLHAAALVRPEGTIIALREDIGRHNAVDKVIGWALQNNVALGGHLLLVSGRGGFEIVQKALVAGIPVLASVSAPSSLAVKLAREFGLTLIGFLRGKRFVTYSAGFRCLCTDSSV